MRPGSSARHRSRAPLLALGGLAPLLVLSQLIPLPLPPPPSQPPSSEPPVQEVRSGFPAAGKALFEDSAATPDPSPLWGSIDCEERSRHEFVDEGGDLEPDAQLRYPGNQAFRRLTLIDGDDYYGARCELGRNDHRDSPVALYREGQRRLTFMSLRLAPGFPLESESWQVVMQMKQSQPSANGEGVPMLALHAIDGRWVLHHIARAPIWSAPARIGVWTRFAFDVSYSRKPTVGAVKVYADVNGDGDATDQGEESPRVHARTLRRERKGTFPDGIRPGRSIPSHLRVGIYQDPAIGCPRPSGCSIDLDNVGVYEPG